MDIFRPTTLCNTQSSNCVLRLLSTQSHTSFGGIRLRATSSSHTKDHHHITIEMLDYLWAFFLRSKRCRIGNIKRRRAASSVTVAHTHHSLHPHQAEANRKHQQWYNQPNIKCFGLTESTVPVRFVLLSRVAAKFRLTCSSTESLHTTIHIQPASQPASVALSPHIDSHQATVTCSPSK